MRDNFSLFMNLKPTVGFYFSIWGFLIFIYLIVRAVKLPMTCDEAQTCLTFSRFSVLEIITYSRSAIPNNHIFHTLLIKFFTTTFGMKLWVCRLPNLLGFIIYYFFCFKILTLNLILDKSISKKSPAQIVALAVGIIILVCNPYLLDFFSLARGYGLACAFMMGSIYFALLFLTNKNTKTLLFSLALGVLSVYTNFTTLNYFVAAWILLVFEICSEALFVHHLTLKNLNKPSNLNQNLKSEIWDYTIILIFSAALLAALSYLPITEMRATNQFIFWGTKGFYEDTFSTLTDSLMYGSWYFGQFTASVLRIITLLLLSGVVILVFIEIKKKKIDAFREPFVFTFILLAVTVVVNIAQHIIVHTPYLQTRTALFFFPLAALPIVLSFKELAESRKKIFYGIVPLFSLLWAFHFFHSINTRYCYEWWYDADTKKILTYLKKEYDNDPEKKKIKLATFSWMMPSFMFHIVEEGRSGWIEVPSSNSTVHPQGMQYYYTFDSEAEVLKKYFQLIKDYGGRVLLKRKENMK